MQDYWYAYDAMNRFTVTMGELVGGVIGKGSSGVEIGYNAASQRTSAVYGGPSAHSEAYTYTADGYLEDTHIDGVLSARRYNDSLGRVVKYQDYQGGAPFAGRSSTYNADNKLLEQIEYTGAVGGTVARSTTYDYLDAPATNNNAGPLASSVMTEGGTTISSFYNYEWWDSAKEKDITAQPYNEQAPNWLAGYSHFQYDVNGHLKQLDDPMAGKAVRFTNDAQGQILVRDELSGGTADINGKVTGAATVNKHHAFYYLNGHRIGDVGNDGPLKVSYAEDLARSRQGNWCQSRVSFIFVVACGNACPPKTSFFAVN